MNKRRYSRVAAAEHLGVSISTIRRMIERGELDTERDGPRSNGKVWVLLADHDGNPDGVPPELDGTPLTVFGDPSPSPNGLLTHAHASPDGMPDDVPGGLPGNPGGMPNLLTEVALLRQQVQYMEERVKDLEQLSQDRADRLKESEWRYHELVKQVTSTMEHVTRALPAASEQPTGQRKRGWWPFRRGQRQ